MYVIDAVGKPCPMPVIEAKKAFADEDMGSIQIIVDNVTAVQNLQKMADGMGYSFSYLEKSKNLFEVTMMKNGHSGTAPKPDTPPVMGKVIVIGKDSLGSGDDQLGKILLKGFIYSLTEIESTPASIIFLNSGAFLTSCNFSTVPDLLKLEGRGTKIITCGTCVRHYDLGDPPGVGSIANMYEIAEIIAAASSVVNI